MIRAIKFIFLVFIAACAIKLPAMMGGAGSGKGILNIDSERGEESKVIPADQWWKQLETGKKESLPEEGRDLLNTMGPSQGYSLKEGMERLSSGAGAEQARSGVKSFKEEAAMFFQAHEGNMLFVVWAVPFGGLVIITILYILGHFHASVLVSLFFFQLVSKFLWVLSLAALALRVFSNANILVILPPDFLIAPVLFILLSGGAIRLIDMNYPFWNKTIGALATPIIASTLVFYWGQAAIVLKSLVKPA